jgi:hypothetical protein
VEMKNCRCGNGCSCNGSFRFLIHFWVRAIFLRFIVFLFVATKSDEASRNSQCKYNVMFA